MAEDDQPQLEVWESQVHGIYGVARFNEKGERSNDLIQGSGAVFYITPTDRRRNQSITRDKRDDPFVNGAFLMREAVEDDSESNSLQRDASKQLAGSDEDLLKFLEQGLRIFEPKVKKLDSAVTVDRMYRMAREQEIGERKVGILAQRLKELDPNASLVGDQLGAGAENPDDPGNQAKGPAPTIDGPSSPRVYPGLDS